MLDSDSIRRVSLATATALGYPTKPNLPLTEADVVLRSVDKVVDRALVLNVMVASTFGYTLGQARTYIDQEGLWQAVSPEEQLFLDGDGSEQEAIRNRVEAINAITWALGITQDMSFDQAADNDLVHRLPNLKAAVSGASFREAASMRPLEEIIVADDLAYCLHWALRECQVTGQPLPGKVHPCAIIERRRALDWILSDTDWDEIPLDT